MDSWFETFCQELVLRGWLSDGRQGVVLAREDFGLVLAGDYWSGVPVPALVEGLAPRWIAMVRAAVMPLVEHDPDTARPWVAGAVAGYRHRDHAGDGVVADVVVIDLVDAVRGNGQWVLAHEASDHGVSFAEAVRAGACTESVLALADIEPRDPGRLPAPNGAGLLPRAEGRLALDLGGARLGVGRMLDAGGRGFAYATEPYATRLAQAGIEPVDLVVLDV